MKWKVQFLFLFQKSCPIMFLGPRWEVVSELITWALGQYTSKGEGGSTWVHTDPDMSSMGGLSSAVNSFDDMPSELSVAVHYFDDIRSFLTTWHLHSSAFLWNLRLISRITQKILFVCFGGFTKNYWLNISPLDEYNHCISILFSFFPLVLDL